VIFHETKLNGAIVIDIEKREDNRGFFARGWCRNEFEAHGLNASVVQTNISFNKLRGTLRGMHYQAEPAPETKLVRCVRGSIYDVIVDVRPDSPTYLQWIGVELSAANYRMLYVPEHFAHGFITLEDNTEVTYQVTGLYTPACERGARHNDPAFGIEWPCEVRVISDKDANWADYQPEVVVAGASRQLVGV
jgi:dTDP-4-dehydrorhamnose 3,5-epimerase